MSIMPILIKSFNGQRSCTVQNNSASRQADILDDIINALKGLTFKFEVKISDVVATAPTVHDDTNTKVSPSKTSRSRFSIDDPVEKFDEEINNDESQRTVDPLKIVEKLRGLEPKIKEEPEVPQPTVPEQSKPQVIEQSKQVEEPLAPQKINLAEQTVVHQKTSVADPTLVPQQVKRTEQPEAYHQPKPTTVRKVPKIIKGDIPLGSTLDRCCLAIDGEADPLLAYIAYDDAQLIEVNELILDHTDEIERLPATGSLSVGDIVFAKSNDDDQWYRSSIESINGNQVDIFFFDWGLRETLDTSRIKYLQIAGLGLAKRPACALKVQFSNPDKSIIDELLTVAHKMRVESYDDESETYLITVLSNST